MKEAGPIGAISSKLRTLAWFARRPAYWAHAASLIRRKWLPDGDRPSLRAAAQEWAANRAVTREEALRAIGYEGEVGDFGKELQVAAFQAAQERTRSCPAPMGGAADLTLLYHCAEAVGALRALETGVAFGWSSFALLASVAGRGGTVASVDMPYPKRGNADWVGVAVPPELASSWRLIRLPDNPGIHRALDLLSAPIDICHYDSDKSYHGRMWAYPILWNALRPGGLFVSDDIQDNFAFREFTATVGGHPVVVLTDEKYVGLCRKPVRRDRRGTE